MGQPGDRGKGNQEKAEEAARRNLADRIEDNLNRLLGKVEQILRENEARVLAVAHALEYYKTLSGGDVMAVIEGQPGPVVDGTIYTTDDFIQKLRDYHQAALQAHRLHSKPLIPLPEPPEPVLAGVIVDPYGLDAYGTATGTNGSHPLNGSHGGPNGYAGPNGGPADEPEDDIVGLGPDDDSYNPPPAAS